MLSTLIFKKADSLYQNMNQSYVKEILNDPKVRSNLDALLRQEKEHGFMSCLSDGSVYTGGVITAQDRSATSDNPLWLRGIHAHQDIAKYEEAFDRTNSVERKGLIMIAIGNASQADPDLTELLRIEGSSLDVCKAIPNPNDMLMLRALGREYDDAILVRAYQGTDSEKEVSIFRQNGKGLYKLSELPVLIEAGLAYAISGEERFKEIIDFVFERDRGTLDKEQVHLDSELI